MESLHSALFGEKELFAGQCSHVFKSGLRCARASVDGDVVCLLHGGNLEQASLSLQRRMLALQEQSLSTIEELMANSDDKTRSTVAIAVLDRTGLGPKSTLQVDKKDDFSGLTMEELAVEFDKLAEAARSGSSRPGETQAEISRRTNEEEKMTPVAAKRSDRNTH